MSKAEAIRRHVCDNIVRRHRKQGQSEFTVRAGDVHRDMRLSNEMPNVCSALRASRFQELAGVELVRTEGPRNGANATFHFRLVDAPVTETAAPQRDEPATSATPSQKEPQPPATPPTASGDRLFLVSCVSKKAATACPARELYQSEWFQRAKAYVEATGCPWFILSAEYGLVHPDERIAPYERTLNRMSAQQRRAWAELVRNQMADSLPSTDEIVVLAGQRYRELLEADLRQLANRVSIPMEGLRFGEQLQWLGQALAR